MRGPRERLPDDVADLLQGNPELLAVADAIQRTYSPANRRWRRPDLVAAIAVAAAVVAGVSLVRSNGRSFVASADAALGGGEVLHAVLARDDPDTEIVAPNGESKPVRIRDEFWFDRETGQLRTRSSRDDQLVVDTISTSAPADDSPDPALAAFVTGYGAALRSGAARIVGSGSIAGDQVEWLAFSPGQQVAVSDTTHLPIVVRRISDGAIADWMVAEIGSEASVAGLFDKPPRRTGFVSGDVHSTTMLTAPELASLPFAPRQPRNPPRSWKLADALREQLINRTADGPSSLATGVRFRYANGSGSEVEVMESPVPAAAYSFVDGLTFNFVPVPSDGSRVVADLGGQSLAQFESSGLFITIKAPDSATALSFAAALAEGA